MTRGLNRTHNPQFKAVFKGAATAAASAPGPLGEYCKTSVSRGVDKDLAKVTLARKIAAVAPKMSPKRTTKRRTALDNRFHRTSV
jgi:hypothetical protein